MDSTNDTINVLEPNSFSIYLAILILSIMIFLISCSGILFWLYLSYKEWCCFIHKYCYNIVHLRIPDLEYESNQNTFPDKTDATKGFEPNKLFEEDDEPIEIFPRNRHNPDNLLARVTKIRLVTKDVLDEVKEIKVIEIEPTGFVEDSLKSEKQIKSMGPDKELGRISFIIEYDSPREELHIRNLRGEGLRKKHSQGILNPYITINIWPDHIWPIKTKVIKKTNTPTWCESIIIENFEYKNLESKALHLKIQSWRQLRPNDLIGHVVLPLQVIKTGSDNDTFTGNFTKNLQPDLQINRGSIRILLLYERGIHTEKKDDEVEDNEDSRKKVKHHLHLSKLTVSILNAKLIYPQGLISDQCQVFVKVSVLHPSHDTQNKFTAIQRGSFQPIWNEDLTFNISDEKIEKLSIIISVREEGFSKEGRLFSYTELGPQHSESNNIHLHTSLKNPNKTIAQWHQLISNIL